MRTALLVVTGLAGTIGAATLAFPQAVKLWRERDDDGVSTATYAIYLAATIIWTGWGLVEGVPFVWISNGIAVLGGAATIAGLARLRGPRVWPVAGVGVLAGLAVIALGVATSPDVAGYIAGAIGVSTFAPQALTALRTDDLSGVSLLTWRLALLTFVSWLVHGLLLARPVMWLPNAIALPFAVIVLVRLARTAPTTTFATDDAA